MNAFTVFRRIRSGLFLLGLALTVPLAQAQIADLPREWNQPLKPFRIIGNVYYVGASDLTSYLITTGEGHILLDSGLEETVPYIRAGVPELGFRLEDIKILLNSHAHFDHAGGLAALKELTGAELVASKEDAAQLAKGGKDDFQYGDKYAFRPVQADRIVNDGDTVERGGVKLTAHLTPGHTKGNVTWTMQVKEGDRTYDVVFLSSPTVPGYRLKNNPLYPGISDDYRKTFQFLKTLPCDVFLATHGYSYSLLKKAEQRQDAATNPFIDPEGFRRHIDTLETAFTHKYNIEK